MPTKKDKGKDEVIIDNFDSEPEDTKADGKGDDEKELELRRLRAENERLAAENAKMKAPRAVAPVDPDKYLFVHKNFRAGELHLSTGKVVKFKNYFGSIPKKDVRTYEALKECQDFKDGIIVEWNPSIEVEDHSVKVYEGTVTTVNPKVA